MKNDKIQWKASSTYIDIETGEIISKNIAKKDYIIIKTKKNAKIKNSYGNIRYTHECRKKWTQLTIDYPHTT